MPPHMVDFCLDWGNLRGHFRFNGQDKRCVRRRMHATWGGYYCRQESVSCHMHVWEETPCTWPTKRSVDGEYVNGTSSELPGPVLDLDDFSADEGIFLDVDPDKPQGVSPAPDGSDIIIDGAVFTLPANATAEGVSATPSATPV
jgi:hypothetical protein